MLGLLIGEISLFDAASQKQISSHLQSLPQEGWYAADESSLRWTTGAGQLALGRRDPDSMGILSIEVAACGPYLLDDDTDDHAIIAADAPGIRVAQA